MQLFKIGKSQTSYLVSATLGFALLFGSTDISVFEILAAIVAVITFFYVIHQKQYEHIPFSKRNYLLLGFVVLVIFQIFLLPEVEFMFALATLYLIGVYGIAQFWFSKEPETKHAMITGYTVGAIFSSLLGLSAYLNALMRDGLENVRFFWEDSVRISVLFNDPVVYGTFLVPAVLILSTKTFLSHTTKSYIVYSSLTLLVFSNLILTGSRGAWLNLLVAAFVFLVLYKRLWNKLILIKMTGLVSLAVILASLLIFVIPIGEQSYYAATLESRYYSSDKPRIENIQSAPERIINRSTPVIIFGSGSGTYEKTTAKGFSAHNTYLRVLYEQGFVGVVLYILLVGFVLKSALKQRRAQPLFAALLVALLVGILVQNLFVDTLHWRHFWILLGLAL